MSSNFCIFKFPRFTPVKAKRTASVFDQVGPEAIVYVCIQGPNIGCSTSCLPVYLSICCICIFSYASSCGIYPIKSVGDSEGISWNRSNSLLADHFKLGLPPMASPRTSVVSPTRRASYPPMQWLHTVGRLPYVGFQLFIRYCCLAILLFGGDNIPWSH